MKPWLALSRTIDTVTDRIGQILFWFVLAAALISGVNAILRKLFNIGSNAWLEVQWYLFAAVFMLGAGYAFLKNAHVRIDFVSGRLTPRTRNWIDIIGIVFFLVPLCVMLINLGWPLFSYAWTTNEMSQNAGGLLRWPVLALIPLGMTLLLVQALSELIKRIAFLRGLIPDPLAHAAPEQETVNQLEAQE
jgi:TRAP-type mannitol/chloroaromatic compound transport system permease small subunit